MKPLAAVLLDVDGTLIYSNDQHARAFLLAARELGLEDPGFEAVRRLIGMGGDKLIPTAFGIEPDSTEGRALDERKGEIFRDRLADQIEATPGARDLVAKLKDRGLRLVVATSANEEDVQLLLGKAGVADLVDACTSSGDVNESKPEPDLVQAALELARVPPESAMMLGDTPYDVAAALGAGVRIVAVRTGGWNDAELRGAERVYADPAAILADFESSPFTATESKQD